MNSIVEDDVTLTVDMDEMGVRPAKWYRTEHSIDGFDSDFCKFPHEKSVEIQLYHSQFTTNSSISTKKMSEESSMSDDEDDRTDFKIDPETGERIYGENDPLTTDSDLNSPSQWVEEFLSKIKANEEETIENFPSEIFENSGEILSNWLNFDENAVLDLFNERSEEFPVEEKSENEIKPNEIAKIEAEESNDFSNFPGPASARSQTQGNQDEEILVRFSIPLSLDEITRSTTEQYNQHLISLTLSAEQIQIIKDIRRRGKNKIAAQNCRKRKAVGVETLAEEVDELKRIKEQLEEQKRFFEQQIDETRRNYEHLHQRVLPHRALPPAIAVK